MVDVDETAVRDEEALERQRLRSYTTIGMALLTLIVLVVVLLFWRACSAEEGGRVARGGGGVVDVVPGMEVSPRDIAIWLMPGARIDDVLDRHDLDSARVTAFDDGLFVLSIGERDPELLLERLRRDPALYDAGFVYAEDD